MIIGKLKDIHHYKGFLPQLDEAIDFLEQNDYLSIENGKHLINNHFFINRSSYIGKPLEECDAESHRKFIDIQIVIKGKEGIGYADITNPTLKVSIPYNEAKDVTKYEVEDELIYTMEDLSFAVTLPEDVHKPMIKIDDNIIEKMVMKLQIKE